MDELKKGNGNKSMEAIRGDIYGSTGTSAEKETWNRRR